MIKNKSLGQWLYTFIKPCAVFSLAATVAGFLILNFMPRLVPLVTVFSLLACVGCYWTGLHTTGELPEFSSNWMGLAFCTVPPVAYWGAVLLFFLIPGGIYIGLPAVIMTFALFPVALPYVLLSLVMNSALPWQVTWMFHLMISVPMPLCFFLGRWMAHKAENGD